MRIYDERNVSMMMDLYEMTMANGYYLLENQDTHVAFDVFYRRNPDSAGFAIFTGLEQIVEYLEGLHFDPEDIDYLRSLGQFDESFLSIWLIFASAETSTPSLREPSCTPMSLSSRSSLPWWRPS